jgi:hypothetical protein
MEELGYEYTKQRPAYTRVLIFSVLMHNLCIAIYFLILTFQLFAKSRSRETLELLDLLKCSL